MEYKYSLFQFYNSDAVCSDLIAFSEVSRDKKSYSDVTFSTTLHFPASTNLLWCLREEALEIQVTFKIRYLTTHQYT